MNGKKFKGKFQEGFFEKKRSEELCEAEVNPLAKNFGSFNPVALVFPNNYSVGMSNLGFHVVYRIINSHPDFSCERFFYPDPGLFSIDNQRPFNEFNVIFFSVSFETDLINVVKMLKEAGIDPETESRQENDPIICFGGHITIINPKLLERYADILFVGEAEDYLYNCLDVIGKAGLQQKTVFSLLSTENKTVIISKYIQNRFPDLVIYDSYTISRPYIHDIKELECHTEIYTKNTEFGDSFLIEITRGCPYKCNFCFTGHALSPFRTVGLETILKEIDQAKEYTKKLGLVSAAVNAHPDIDRICSYIIENDLRVSFSSLRIETISEKIIEALIRSEQFTITIAPEAGTDSLRTKINKRIKNSVIIDKVRLISEMWMRGNGSNKNPVEFKFYFMINLPEETREDREGISVLIKEIREVLEGLKKEKGFWYRIVVNLGIFVPKPGTPFHESINFEKFDKRVINKKLEEAEKPLNVIKGVIIRRVSVKEAIEQFILANTEDAAVDLLRKYYKKPFSEK